jgi:hypothetical protein
MYVGGEALDRREGRSELLAGLAGLDLVWQRCREDLCRQVPPSEARLRELRIIDKRLARARESLLAGLTSLACEDLGPVTHGEITCGPICADGGSVNASDDTGT